MKTSPHAAYINSATKYKHMISNKIGHFLAFENFEIHCWNLMSFPVFRTLQTNLRLSQAKTDGSHLQLGGRVTEVDVALGGKYPT